MTESTKVLALLCALVAASPASAEEEAIERCRAEADSASRIACLEAALRGDAPPEPTVRREPAPIAAGPDAWPAATPPPAAVQGGSPADPAAPAPVAEAQTAPPAVAGADGATGAASADEPGPGPAPVAESTSAAATETGTEAAAESATESADIGAEQLPRTAAERDAALARATGLVVTAYEHVPYRRLVVHLENGQVWRQVKGDTQYVRASLGKNRTVDIEESGLGGYRLRLNEMRRTIRVQRVR